VGWVGGWVTCESIGGLGWVICFWQGGNVEKSPRLTNGKTHACKWSEPLGVVRRALGVYSFILHFTPSIVTLCVCVYLQIRAERQAECEF
jgi:hypothetical protein